jgi:predicted DNA binding CopG/RHH family protein
MDLAPYVEQLRRELATVADAGGDDARALAQRLSAPLESAARLILLQALSTAAAEITRDLAPGSVDLRLRGLDPDFVVTPPPVEQWFEDTVERAPSDSAPIADDGATSRINLRLPEQLKVRIEEAAAKEGLSVNAWLVRALAATLDDGGTRAARGHASGGQRYTGWVR